MSITLAAGLSPSLSKAARPQQISRQMFADILSLVARLRAPPAPA
jgi:hypothetical protein